MATLMEFAAMQLERDGYSSRADALQPSEYQVPERPPYLHVRLVLMKTSSLTYLRTMSTSIHDESPPYQLSLPLATSLHTDSAAKLLFRVHLWQQTIGRISTIARERFSTVSVTSNY